MAEKNLYFLDDLKIQKLCASVQWKHSVQSHFSKAMVTNTSPTESPNTTARSPRGRRVHSVSGLARASPLILRNGCRRPGRVIYFLLVVRLTLRGSLN